MRKLRKLQKLRKLRAKIRRCLFLWDCSERRRAAEKKITKKDLQVSVNHAIMDSNKEAAMSGKGELTMKYRGLVKNRLNGEVRKTRWCKTYEKAHRQAESLGMRVYGRNDNWGIHVVVEEKEQ